MVKPKEVRLQELNKLLNEEWDQPVDGWVRLDGVQPLSFSRDSDGVTTIPLDNATSFVLNEPRSLFFMESSSYNAPNSYIFRAKVNYSIFASMLVNKTFRTRVIADVINQASRSFTAEGGNISSLTTKVRLGQYGGKIVNERRIENYAVLENEEQTNEFEIRVTYVQGDSNE